MENNLVVTLIYANTYTEDEYGCSIEIFGIATNKECEQKICKSVKEKGYTPKTDSIPLNEYHRKYIGGYIE